MVIVWEGLEEVEVCLENLKDPPHSCTIEPLYKRDFKRVESCDKKLNDSKVKQCYHRAPHSIKILKENKKKQLCSSW